jgi:hypothetical protein
MLPPARNSVALEVMLSFVEQPNAAVEKVIITASAPTSQPRRKSCFLNLLVIVVSSAFTAFKTGLLRATGMPDFGLSGPLRFEVDDWVQPLLLHARRLNNRRRFYK